ncbi:hypothetical protein BJI47_11065 [Rhodococcus sp. 1168]|nr:hypothetical protein BJI47_11065 [Rhodococcus sp. 1168]
MCAMCDGQSMEGYVRKVHGLVDRHGWALQYVNSEVNSNFDPDNAGVIEPAFCYTVGLTALGHPELIVTGRSPGESAAALNTLARRVILGGRAFEPGMESAAAGFDFHFVDVTYCDEWLLMASEVYPSDRIRAVQAVWRDSQGDLPWEGDVSSTIVQPILGTPLGWGLYD